MHDLNQASLAQLSSLRSPNARNEFAFCARRAQATCNFEIPIR